MLFREQFETDRLVLERLCHETVDAFALYDRFGNGAAAEEVFEHVPQDPYSTVKTAHDRIDDAEQYWDDTERADYAVRPNTGEDGAGELAGIATLNCEWERRTGVLGLVLAKPFWGRGYAGERAAALLDYAFDRLDLELVSAGYNAGNDKSRRAIERYMTAHGGQYDGVIRNCVPMGDEIADLHRYSVTQDDYRRATRDS